MNRPSDTIIVDAAILISAVCGRSIGAIENVGQYISLVTSARAIEETRRRNELGLKRPDLLPVLDFLMVGIQVVQMDKLVQLLPDAEWTLKGSQNNKCGALRLAASELGLSKQNKRRTYCSGCPKCAVASNNGSSKDAHLVALAWSIDVDIWTTDRDFAGTGIASWSTPNLLRALNV